MKPLTVEGAKDQVAKSYQYNSWIDFYDFCIRNHMTAHLNDSIDEAILFYHTSQKEKEWISVKDKLPEEKVKVLVCLTYGSGKEEIQTSYYVKRTESFDHFMNDIITHWMPLPHSPTKKD